MLKKYLEISPSEEAKIAPDSHVLNSILNFSKSIEVKEVKKRKILIHLN